MLNVCCLHNFSGKIKYSTEPPENYIRAAYLSTKIITDMNQEFDIGALIAEEKSSLEGKNRLVISFYVQYFKCYFLSKPCASNVS